MSDMILLLKLGGDKMIECEKCTNYFHPDEIESCPECGKELCESCYEEHVTKCINQDIIEDEYDEECRYPHECPECDSELELDVSLDGPSIIYCTNQNCDFKMEFIYNEDN